MAVCENYKCIQRKRECKKLLQGWSKQLLTLVGMEAILESFVGEDVASYLLKNSRVDSPHDFDSSQKFCFYNNIHHDSSLEGCGSTKFSASTAAVAESVPANAARSVRTAADCASVQNGLASSSLAEGVASRLLLNSGNLGSAGGPLCFALDSTLAESEGLDEETEAMSQLQGVVDASTLFSAFQQQHSQQQAVAAMAAASQYLSLRNSTISQLLSSDAQPVGRSVDAHLEEKIGYPQEEPLDLTIRSSIQPPVKFDFHNTQELKSRMFSSSNNNSNNSKNSTNALHAFSTFLSAKAASPSVSTSAKQLLQQLNAEVSNCSDSKSENSTHNTSNGSGHCNNSQHADQSSQGSNGGAPLRKTYTEAELTKAVRAILHGKLGTRRASAEFGIPRSTLRNKICKLNEMKRKEEEITGRRIEMEDFLESVINTPIFQVNCRREIAPAKLITHSKLPNSFFSNEIGTPSPPKKPCLSNGASLSASSLGSTVADKQAPSSANSTPSCVSVGGGCGIKPSTPVVFPAIDVQSSSSPCATPPNSSVSEISLNNAFTNATHQKQHKQQTKQRPLQQDKDKQSQETSKQSISEAERQSQLQEIQLRELQDSMHQSYHTCGTQRWTSSNIVTSMVEVAKRCLSMSEEEKSTYLDQQYRKYGKTYNSNFVQYIPWFMVSMFSNPTVVENLVSSSNGTLDSSSTAALTAALSAASSNAPSSSLLDGFLTQCAASAVPMLEHAGASPPAVALCERAVNELHTARASVQDGDALPPIEARITNHSSSSTTEPALSVALETGSISGEVGGSCCESWSSSPSPEVEASVLDNDRAGSLPGGGSASPTPSGTMDSEGMQLKSCRSKRGNYRRYNAEALSEAVDAVVKRRMTVHKAGNQFGVPHSTLEYKVKERFLRQEHHIDDDDDGLSSPAESTSGADNPPLGAGGIIFPGMDADEEEEEDGVETDGERVPVLVTIATVAEEDGGGSADVTAKREVSLADRSSSLSPPLSDSC